MPPNGGTATLTISMGWNYPHRDHYNYAGKAKAGKAADGTNKAGASELTSSAFTPFGNQYSKNWPSSVASAQWQPQPQLAQQSEQSQRTDATTDANADTDANDGLLAALADISAWHTALSASSVPTWLQDLLINSLSHTRDALWWQTCPTG